MACNNCGLQKPMALVPVNRFRKEGGGEHTEYWCLECIQGENQLENSLMYLRSGQLKKADLLR